jgi:hypothetical protein
MGTMAGSGVFDDELAITPTNREPAKTLVLAEIARVLRFALMP